MFRLGFVFICLGIVACNNSKSPGSNENGFSYETFSNKFLQPSLPYQLADTSILRNRDTTVIKARTLTGFISDSLKNKLFGKNGKVKYVALARFNKPNSETYYIIKGINGNRRAAIVMVFDKNEQFETSFTFLNPAEAHISQVSTMDKSFSISRSRIKKKPDGSSVVSREVYQYNPDKKKFLLIMTDAPGEGLVDVINPIDSFPRHSKLAGDYVRNRKNFVSLRDGRHANQLLFFIHLEDETGCTGELKGELLLTSSNTGLYRHGGDPCVLSFRFSPPFVTLKEDEGCGSHRGLDCLFAGNFQKKLRKPKSKRKKFIGK